MNVNQRLYRVNIDGIIKNTWFWTKTCFFLKNLRKFKISTYFNPSPHPRSTIWPLNSLANLTGPASQLPTETNWPFGTLNLNAKKTLWLSTQKSLPPTSRNAETSYWPDSLTVEHKSLICNRRRIELPGWRLKAWKWGSFMLMCFWRELSR